ncbi:uncharacterized protein LOC115321405 [Ixodes scapularis]|uniref:uncharacterized protein LOC115321405 n=1 Tax=Ixodes scapularis TaxID=6945 RepID=UPI001A9E2EDE|nr:uncharacterized protein LOC115321405 [Ixodes scapularis]
MVLWKDATKFSIFSWTRLQISPTALRYNFPLRQLYVESFVDRGASAWFCDGTFKVVPSLFYQLCTIHALKNGITVPMVYGLLTNKTVATHRRFFQAVIDNIGPCAAQTLYTDFEMAAINAARDTISEVQIQGCFFHLAQSVYRKLCPLGFQARYATDETFAVKDSLFWPMKMLLASAFLPAGDIPEAFQDIMEAFSPEAIQVADYFEDVYIGRPRRNGICSAQLPPKMWSVHEATVGGMPQTNNSVEAWHYGLQSNVSCASPNFWAFLKSLKKEQAITELKLSQAASGVVSTRVSRKRAGHDRRLRAILHRYDGTNNLDIVEACARRISL